MSNNKGYFLTFPTAIIGFLAPLLAGYLFVAKKGISLFNFASKFDPRCNIFVVIYVCCISFVFLLISLKKDWFFLGLTSFIFSLLYFTMPLVVCRGINQKIIYLICFYLIFILMPYVYIFVTCKNNNAKNKVVCDNGWTGPLVMFFAGIYLCDLFAVFIYNAVQTSRLNNSFGFITRLFNGLSCNQIKMYFLVLFGVLFFIKIILLLFKKNHSKNLLYMLIFATGLYFIRAVFYLLY